MINYRKVDILRINNYPSKGLIATIHFFDDLPPSIDHIIEFGPDRYKIKGIVMSGNSKLLEDNFDKNIYDCLIERFEEDEE